MAEGSRLELAGVAELELKAVSQNMKALPEYL